MTAENNREYFDNHIERLKKIRRDEVASLINESNIPLNYLRYKWSDYKDNSNEKFDNEGNPIRLPNKAIQSRRLAKNVCMEYCKNLKTMKEGKIRWGSLLITGEQGSGKTVLGVLILKEVIRLLREDVLYIPFTVLISELYTSKGDALKELIERYCEPKFLLIDEIDYGHYTPSYLQQSLTTILTKRDNYQTPTIITSKVRYNDLANILGLPGYRLIGRSDSYYHIDILNKEIPSAEELLSSNSGYSGGKAKEMVRWINQIIKINTELNMPCVLYGNQIKDCLESATWGGDQSNKARKEIEDKVKLMAGKVDIKLHMDGGESLNNVKNKSKVDRDIEGELDSEDKNQTVADTD